MKQLQASYFFDLADFTHTQLFDASNHAWNALDNLKAFFEQQQLGRIDSPVPEGVTLVNPELIVIESDVTIEPGAYINGPCWIGRGSTVRHCAYLRGNVVTGEKCVIGHCTEVKNSIFLSAAQAAHFAYVGDSILGNNVNLGAGTRLANLKLNGKNVRIKVGDQIVSTERRKLGAIIGDRAQLGCNCVTNPGTLIDADGWILPCQNVGGWIPKVTEARN